MSHKFTDMIKNILPAIKQKNIDYMSLNRLRQNLSTDSTLPSVIPYEQKTRRTADKLLKKLESRRISLDAPEVILNPFGLTPLCALVLFHTENPCGLTYTVKGRDPSADWRLSYEKKTAVHAVPIFGLYPDANNVVEITLLDDDHNMLKSTDVHIRTTGPVSGPLSITDNNGDIRYVLTLPAASHSLEDIQMYGNGRFLVRDSGICTPTETKPLPTHLYETDLLGRILRTCYVGSGIVSFLGAMDENHNPLIETRKNDGSRMAAALDLTSGAINPGGGFLTGPGRIMERAEQAAPFPFQTNLTEEHLSVFQGIPCDTDIFSELAEIPFSVTGWLREPIPYKGASIETSSAVDCSVMRQKYRMDFSICGDTLLIHTKGNTLQEVVFSKSDRIYQLDLTTPLLPSEDDQYTLAVPFTEMYSGTYSIVVRFRDGGQEALADTLTLSRTRK